MGFGSSDRQVGIDVVAHDMASAELARVGSGVSGVTDKLNAGAKAAGGFHSSFTSLIQGAAMGVGMMAFQQVERGVMGVAQAMIGGAAENEKYETQLSVLLGSVDKAKERYAELVQFAKVTPFEIPEVVRASKTLQVFGGDLLATGDNLTLVGDIAAGTGMQFDETAMWIGRMYDAMKSGRPFGEAAMRLQEMGAMSGETRAKLEQMALGVKDGSITMDVAWAAASQAFGRYSGMMQKQSETFEGKWSNLMDSVHQGLARLGAKALPALKSGIDGAIAMFESLFGAIEQVGPVVGWLGDHMDVLVPILAAVAIVIAAELTPAVVGYTVAMVAAAAATVVAAAPYIAIVAAIAGVIFVLNQLGLLSPMLTAVVAGIGMVGDALRALVDYLFGPLLGGINVIADALGWLGDRINDFTGQTERELEESAAKTGVAMQLIFTTIKEKDMGPAAADAAEPIPDKFAAAGIAAVKVVKQTMADVAKEIHDGRAAIVDAMKSVIDDTYDPMITAGKLAAVEAELNSKEMQANLHSTNAKTRAEAKQHFLELAKDRATYLAELTQWGDAQTRTMALKATATSLALVQGLHSKDTELHDWSVNAAREIASEIADLDEESGIWGTRTGNAYIDGLVTTLESGRTRARLRAGVGTIREIMEAGSPPGPASPLHEIDVWGLKTGEAWSDGVAAGLTKAQKKAAAVLKEFAEYMKSWRLGELGGVADLIGGGTPATDIATLEGYKADLQKQLVGEIDPNKRLDIYREIEEYTARIADLRTRPTTADQQAIDDLRGYISNLDRALLVEKDPTKREVILDQIETYLARIDTYVARGIPAPVETFTPADKAEQLGLQLREVDLQRQVLAAAGNDALLESLNKQLEANRVAQESIRLREEYERLLNEQVAALAALSPIVPASGLNGTSEYGPGILPPGMNPSGGYNSAFGALGPGVAPPVMVTVAPGAVVVQGAQNPEQTAKDLLLAIQRELSRQDMSFGRAGY